MIEPKLIQLTERYLFADEEEMERARLRKDQRGRILRLRTLYTYWLHHPQKGDTDMVSEARRLGAGQRQAYDDVRVLKICLGNLQSMTREWYQYLFIQRAEESFRMARAAGDAKAFASTLSALGKFTRLDHDEVNMPDYSQIAPQSFEITGDATDAGYQRISNLPNFLKKLERQFLSELRYTDSIEIVEPEPIPHDEPAALLQQD